MGIERTWNLNKGDYETLQKTTVTIGKGYPKFEVHHVKSVDSEYLLANGRTYRIHNNTTPYEALEDLKEILRK